LFSPDSNIVIIGAGKFAYSLVPALQEAGYNVGGIVSKNLTSAKTLANKYQIPYQSDEINSKKDFKVFFLTVPDSLIREVTKKLSKLKLDFPSSLFIHVSGALDISELKTLSKKKASTASFHIMQTFPSKKAVDLKNSYAAIETSNKKALKYLLDLSTKLKLKAFIIPTNQKVYYHLAGVFASNFLVGNLFASEKLFSKNKKGGLKFFDIAKPIVYSTLANIEKEGAAKALSGPVERGDFETIKKHISALKKKTEYKNMFRSYISQSLVLLEVSREKNGELSKEQKRIRKLLIAALRGKI
jgi:predicted short-subunit dehydrogenase-like oxidoreductase (DUF2520 family)